MTPLEQAVALWWAGVAAVDGYAATERALSETRRAPDQIIAVGKAAGAMACAALDRFGDVPALVVTKDGHGADLPRHVRLIEAAHPVPDERSLIAGRALRACVMEQPETAHLLLLVSGGASSLAEDPVEGETLESLAALNQHLLASGLDIAAMNAERRKLSRIKGGRLLAGFKGAHADILAISDVPGDDLGVIGSGIGMPPDDHPGRWSTHIIASNAVARTAAARAAEDQDLRVLQNEEALYGDAPALAQRLGAELRKMPTGVVILGGEPTVHLPDNPGEGGRNQALALELAREISGIPGLVLVVGGTDGTDGPTRAAGGVVDGHTWRDGAQDALDRADSGRWLDDRDARFVTGPTGTNVMDLLIAVRH